jgi:hypothetical protein
MDPNLLLALLVTLDPAPDPDPTRQVLRHLPRALALADAANTEAAKGRLAAAQGRVSADFEPVDSAASSAAAKAPSVVLPPPKKKP